MLFSVPAFIGFACCEVGKNELTTSPVAVMIIIASKVRGKVASIPFEQFHKHSAEIITAAVFGKNTEINNEVVFSANNVVCNHMCNYNFLSYADYRL